MTSACCGRTTSKRRRACRARRRSSTPTCWRCPRRVLLGRGRRRLQTALGRQRREAEAEGAAAKQARPRGSGSGAGGPARQRQSRGSGSGTRRAAAAPPSPPPPARPPPLRAGLGVDARIWRGAVFGHALERGRRGGRRGKRRRRGRGRGARGAGGGQCTAAAGRAVAHSRVQRLTGTPPHPRPPRPRSALPPTHKKAIDLKSCDVYSYKSDNETDPFGEKANVWAFNYFFYNRWANRGLRGGLEGQGQW
jgi:hypothetical protein